jgi:hypothetical protein
MQRNCNTERPVAPTRTGFEDADWSGPEEGDMQPIEYDGLDGAEAYEMMYGEPPPMPEEKGKRGRLVRESNELQLADFFQANGDTDFARELRARHRQREREVRKRRIALARSRARTHRSVRRGFRRMARRSTPSTAAGGGDPDPDPEWRAVDAQGEREEVRYVRA